MWRKPIQTARPMRIRATLASLAAGLCLAGCVAVFWADSTAYANLSNPRLESLVGVKGSCCMPGQKTSCSSTGLFACASSGVVCDAGGTSFDTCGGPGCTDSDTATDKCDSSQNASYSVTVTTCGVTSAAPVPCDGGGLRCEYVTASATVDFTGCGSSTICAVTSGAACQ
jgi:hypothetical protein